MENGMLEKLQLSMYEELSKLNNRENIWLVKEKSTDILYVKKTLSQYDKNVYESLQKAKVPGIPQIVELIEADGILTIIEEHINGQILAGILENCLLKEPEALSILIQLKDILNQLHSMTPPIIHRDIKAGNVIVTNNAVYLIDFNAARTYKPEQGNDTVILGTNGYAPPEQYGFGQTDCRSDVYSLAVLFHVMLTGQYPKDNILYPGPVGTVIEKATSLSPKNRYATIEQFVQAISKAIGNNAQMETVKNNYNPKKWWHLLFEIPGFRQRKIPHMIGSLLLYLCFLAFAEGTNMHPEHPINNAISKVLCFLMYLFMFFLCSDFRGIRNYFSGTHNPNKFLRCLSLIGYCLLSVLAVAVISTILNTFFPY